MTNYKITLEVAALNVTDEDKQVYPSVIDFLLDTGLIDDAKVVKVQELP